MERRTPGPKTPKDRDAKIVAMAEVCPELPYSELARLFGVNSRQRIYQILQAARVKAPER